MRAAFGVFAFIVLTPPLQAADAPAWNGFERRDFKVDGRDCLLALPKAAAGGKPWIWRTEFFGHEPQADLALLAKGFHVAYMNVQNMYGAPVALDHMDKFYQHLTTAVGLGPKTVLEGFSRGGLFALNWAARNPDKVACIYNDAPVCDFKSWPAGKGKGKGSRGDWQQCLKAYGLTEAEALAYKGNPVDNLEAMAKAKIPLLHICGDADDVVPIDENTRLLEARYRKLGGPITVIAKSGVGHHPHSLKDPTPIVAFVLVNTIGPSADVKALRELARVAAEAKLENDRFNEPTQKQLKGLVAGLTDPQIRNDAEQLLPAFEQAAPQYARDRALLAEVKRLNGIAMIDVSAPLWLRATVGDDALPNLGRIVELELNERTDGHKDPIPKKLSERVNDDWLKILAGQDQLRRLELSGTAVTSAGLVHLKGLTNLERLNVCLTAVDDRGFEHLAGMTKMKRMVICASKITGSGFKHLEGMKQIESINLHSAPASDEGLEAIGKLTSLRRLEIVHTKVTDAGLKHLAGLVNLQQFHVHGPETTATALPFLSQLKELYELDVYDKAASNQTLEQIAKLPKLRMLMLVNGTFDDESVKNLAKLTALESPVARLQQNDPKQQCRNT